MRLFGYYAWHSFINQIRKLFKTWIFILILVCGLIGGLIGFGTSVLFEESDNEEVVEEVIIEQEEPSWIERKENGIVQINMDGKSYSFPVFQIGECLAFLVVIALVIFFISTANGSGGKLFLLADVNLLFSSDMKPQSILLFRMLTRLGIWLFFSIYFGICYMPMIMDSTGMSAIGEILFFITWFFALAYCQMLQLLSYMMAASKEGMEKKIQMGLYVLGALILFGYGFYWKSSGENMLVAFISLFSLPVLHYVPIFGWIQAIIGNLFVSNWLTCLIYFALLIAGMAGLVYYIWSLKVDFYEDALAKSEEKDRQIRAIKENGGMGLKGISKKKKQNIQRRESFFAYGMGANVFYYKALHNRTQVAYFGSFTKTNIFYLAMIGLLLAFNQMFYQGDVFQVGILMLAGLVFFRSLGNPLEEDIKTDFFYLIPEPTWKKLFYSLFGSSMVCLYDLIPAVLVLTVLSESSPISAFLWLVVILSVHLYTISVGSFIHLSVPANAGGNLKQMVQVMFVYFGLLPDVGLIAYGLVKNQLILAVLAVFIINMILTVVFLSLASTYMQPKGGEPIRIKEFKGNKKEAVSTFSRVGFAFAIMSIVTTVLQIVFAQYVKDLSLFDTYPILLWALSLGPLYLVGMPIGYLILRKLKPSKIVSKKFRLQEFFQLVCVGYFLMYLGNIVGTLVGMFLQRLFSLSSNLNTLTGFLATDSLFLKILFMVICAPILEELFFRKLLIDRVIQYGEKNAIFLSAFIFGLFHGNITQFCYATLLGIVLGYIYIQTGKLRYSIGIHMILNFWGSIVASIVAKDFLTFVETFTVDMNGAPFFTQLSQFISSHGFMAARGLFEYFGYLLVLLLVCLIGLVYFFVYRTNAKLELAPNELAYHERVQILLKNPGMICMILTSLAMIIYILCR